MADPGEMAAETQKSNTTRGGMPSVAAPVRVTEVDSDMKLKLAPHLTKSANRKIYATTKCRVGLKSGPQGLENATGKLRHNWYATARTKFTKTRAHRPTQSNLILKVSLIRQTSLPLSNSFSSVFFLSPKSETRNARLPTVATTPRSLAHCVTDAKQNPQETSDARHRTIGQGKGGPHGWPKPLASGKKLLEHERDKTVLILSG